MLILSETWHVDLDSAAIQSLQSHGVCVVEAVRPIAGDAKPMEMNFANHGGLAIVHKPGINIARLRTNMTGLEGCLYPSF